MDAYSNILAALIERRHSGRGRHIDLSMLESLAEWMGFPMYYAFEGAAPPSRAGVSHATIFPHGPFAVGGGSSVMLGVQNDREWQVFCTHLLLQPDLAQDPRYRGTPRHPAAPRSAARRATNCVASLRTALPL